MYLIVVGAGEIGTPLVEQAVGYGYEVVVVENDPERADHVATTMDCLVLNADGTHANTLTDAGADRADAIISTTDSDATNLMVMLLAQELDVPSRVSVVHNETHKHLFRQAGVNVIENPAELISEYLFRAVQRPSVKDFMHLAGSAEVFEVTVTSDAPVAGTSLRDAGTHGLIDDDVLVVAIERDRTVLAPKGETVIEAGDLVTVFSKQGFAPEVMDAFTGESQSAESGWYAL